jgi:hypothetical protein
MICTSIERLRDCMGVGATIRLLDRLRIAVSKAEWLASVAM